MLVSSLLNLTGKKQVLSGSEHDIVKNPKKPGRNCQFCQNCKTVRGCPMRAELKMHATEYVLTNEHAGVEMNLRARINTMPIAPSLKTTVSVLGTVSRESLNANFIIHSASLIQGCSPDIQGMNFCVSFLSSNAQPMGRVWVSGSAMNSMITHNLKKKKFVYDETIIHKSGWTSRYNKMSNYEGSDDDDTPISQLKIVV